VNQKAFRGALELSTSVGTVSNNVTSHDTARPSASTLKDRVVTALRGYPAMYAIARRLYRAAIKR
jgi:hypothetical protein